MAQNEQMTTPEYFLYLDDDFYLRPLKAADLDGRWSGWFNDAEVTRYQSKGFYPNTYESQKQYFDSIAGSRVDVVLAIIDRQSDRHIGNVGLHQIDYIHRTAILGIVIGERASWGRGIGVRSWRAITNYGFDVLNLHKICATVVDGNERSLKCALGVGFEIEGCQVQQIFKNGTYLDLIYLGLLKDRWQKLNSKPS